MTFAQVDRLDQLVDHLQAVAVDLANLGDVDQAAAEAVERAGAPFAPRRTGRLASSTSVVAGVISSTVTYAAPVHWGWSRGNTRVAARPWLVDAAETTADDVLDLYGEHVDDSLGKV